MLASEKKFLLIQTKRCHSRQTAIQVHFIFLKKYLHFISAKIVVKRHHNSSLSKFSGACAKILLSQDPTSTCFSSYLRMNGCFSNSLYFGLLVTSFVKLSRENENKHQLGHLTTHLVHATWQ